MHFPGMQWKGIPLFHFENLQREANHLKEGNIPVFHVRDTESSHGRYSHKFKEIRFEDLVKFHGHACDGLYRGSYALSVAFDALFPDGTVDRTDLRAVSRNSPRYSCCTQPYRFRDTLPPPFFYQNHIQKRFSFLHR